ncbi:uncharacterized protein HKW66_Vig0192420 [Vigna angularis]|uniref:Transmembrane protein n=2 Tax=Phaseolus angularis TaxID=3914 RepID=A0A8T0KQK3_PHAAN|nr:uncharacterized protein HKW66_Vig0192420 [Vigna angularis]
MSLSFCILFMITFTLFIQPIPVKADLKMRKLGVRPSPPPPPRSGPQRHVKPVFPSPPPPISMA